MTRPLCRERAAMTRCVSGRNVKAQVQDSAGYLASRWLLEPLFGRILPFHRDGERGGPGLVLGGVVEVRARGGRDVRAGDAGQEIELHVLLGGGRQGAPVEDDLALP